MLDLNIPIFLAQGTDDIMAPPQSARTLQESFAKNGKTNLHYKEYPGYDHEYKSRDKKSHLVDVIVEAIGWILDKK